MSPGATVNVLAIDLGTGSVKIALVDPDLRVRQHTSRTYDVRSPEPGAALGEPAQWADAVRAGVGEVLDRAAADGQQAPTAVGLSGQMHGVVLLAESGQALGPALLWPDIRAAHEVGLLAAAPRRFRTRLANPLVPGMAGPMLGLLARTQPGLVARAAAAVQPKDWLRVALAGPAALAADPSDASATLLWDLPGDHWSAPAARLLGVPAALLVAVVPSDRVVATTTGDLGVPAGLPVVVGAADTACAALGTGTVRAGLTQVSIGTGAQVVAPLAGPPAVGARPVTHTYRAAVPGSWYRLGAVQNAGLALERVLGWLGADWAEALSTLDRRPAGDPVFLPHLSGERTPWLNPGLRGAWAGLGLQHHREDLLRAALVGVACAVADAWDAVTGAGPAAPQPPLLVGGGSRGDAWRRLLADVLGTPLVTASSPHAAVLGAAALARSGVGAATLAESAAALEVAARAGGVEVEPSEDGGRWTRATRERAAAARAALSDVTWT